MRAWRKANPIAAWLTHIRQRASKKKLPFDIELDWFEAFLARNFFDRASHQLDRIIPDRGYVWDNLQLLTETDNIAKGNRERHGQYHFF